MNPNDVAEARTRALTTLIHYLQPQTDLPTPGNAQSATGRAYHHIATLLTRGVEDDGSGRSVIAVTGAHNINSSAVTAVTSDTVVPSSPLVAPSSPLIAPSSPLIAPSSPLIASSSPLITPSSPPLDQTLSKAHMAVTQNRSPYKDFHSETVEPNPLSVKEICESLCVFLSFCDFSPPYPRSRDATRNITLTQHAADVLKALVSTEGVSASSTEFFELRRYSLKIILRRCFPKIRHRVLGVKYVFSDALSNLYSWTPHPDDALDSDHVWSSKLVSHSADGDILVDVRRSSVTNIFDQYGVVKDPTGKYLLNIKNASTWLKVFINVFGRVTYAVTSYVGDDDSHFRLYFSLHDLHWYVYNLHELLEAILDVTSLSRVLRNARPLANQISFAKPENKDTAGGIFLRYYGACPYLIP
jgi:hypothetical protein